MANDGLLMLIAAIGGTQGTAGRQATVDAINRARKLSGDTERPTTLRQINDWIHRRLPPAACSYLLAACVAMGIDTTRAVLICPDLKPARAMAATISSQVAPRRARSAA